MKENPTLMCFHCGVNGASLIPSLWVSKAQALGHVGDSHVLAFLSTVIGGSPFWLRKAEMMPLLFLEWNFCAATIKTYRLLKTY